MVRKQLFEFRLAARSSAAYGAATLAITGVFAFMITFADELVARYGVNVRSVQVVLLFLAILAFNPVRERMQRLVDNFFDRDRSRYRLAVREISEAMVSMLSMSEIGDRILVALTDTMGVSRAMVLLFDERDRVLRASAWRGDWEQADIDTEIPSDHPIWKHLWMRREELSRSDFDDDPDPEKRESCWDIYDTLEVELLVPILFGVDLLGVIAVGRKLSGERLAADDRQLLRTLANQSSIAIENAKAFDEIAKLNESARGARRGAHARAAGDPEPAHAEREAEEPRTARRRRRPRAEQPDRLRPCEPPAARRVHREARRGPGARARTPSSIATRSRSCSDAQPRGHRARQADRPGPADVLAHGSGRSADRRSSDDEIDRTLALMEPRFKGSIEVVRDYDALPEVRCYPGQLNQVFLNLLMNACDVLEDGGQDHDSDRADAGWRTDRVRGYGPRHPGVESARASSIPSSRRRRSARARDSVSRCRMASSNDTVDVLQVLSAPGRGAIFQIDLPLVAPEQEGDETSEQGGKA